MTTKPDFVFIKDEEVGTEPLAEVLGLTKSLQSEGVKTAPVYRQSYPTFLTDHESVISVRFEHVIGFVLKRVELSVGEFEFEVVALYETAKLSGVVVLYKTSDLPSAKLFLEKVAGLPLAKIIGP